jgi:hypothetical protein
VSVAFGKWSDKFRRLQAKLKNLHEVVVRNRLEQLRKMQRDEAIQAQEELLAGVAKSASLNAGSEIRATPMSVQQEVVPAEEMEIYDRSMSPRLTDITTLPLDERQIDIVTEEADWRSLVRNKIFFKGPCNLISSD